MMYTSVTMGTGSGAACVGAVQNGGLLLLGEDGCIRR